MLPQRIEKLKQEYTGRYVLVDGRRPELARFAGVSARVKTVNFNGRALVQFEGADRSWYDVELDHLKVVDPPQPAAEAPSAAEGNRKKQESPAAAGPAAQKVATLAPPEAKEKLSRLELARLEKQTGQGSP